MYNCNPLWKKMSVLRKDKEGISMNLPEALVYTDIDHLSRIAKYYELSVNLSSKNSLIQSILQVILDQRKLERQIEQLSVLEHRFLLVLLLENLERLTLEELLAKASNVLKMEGGGDRSLPTNRSMVNMLLSSGWLFVDKRAGHHFYSIPNDLKERLINVLKKVENASNNGLISRDIQVSNDLLSDMKSFLHYVTREIVNLTMDGIIHKRHQIKIFSEFSAPENPLEGKEWRFGYGRRFPNYPNRFAILYDFLYENNFINEENNLLTLTSKGHLLLNHELQVTTTDIYQFWIKLYKKPIRNIQLILSLIKFYCNDWLEIDTLEHKVIDFVEPFFYDTKYDVLHKRILQPLLWFDFLKSEYEGKRRYLKAASTIFVQK